VKNREEVGTSDELDRWHLQDVVLSFWQGVGGAGALNGASTQLLYVEAARGDGAPDALVPSVELLSLQVIAGRARPAARAQGRPLPGGHSVHVVDVENPAVAVDPRLPNLKHTMQFSFYNREKYHCD
jgi:hypothetical protein